MQSYNPSVNDNSGQLLAGGINAAADAVGWGMSKKAEQGMMDRKTLDMNLGKLEQYQQAGLMDPETYGKFVAMPVSRMSGALAGFEATVVNPHLEQQRSQANAAAQAQIRAASGAGGGNEYTF